MLLDKPDTEPVTDTAGASALASWQARAAALAIDVLFGLAVVAGLALAMEIAPQYGWLWWSAASGAVLILVLVVLNRLLAPALTGWSLGRALLGITVMLPDDEEALAGPWRLLARDLAHLLDTAGLFVGWLWPLWDSRNRTFADLLLRTEVRRDPDHQPDVRRLAAIVLVAGALLATAGAGLTYLTVYHTERAVDTARTEISEQGPALVEQMLTYSASTMKDDFAHAQTVVTDQYRPQLIAQQQAVEKNKAATNEYWAVTSAVLSVSSDRAMMLVFLQGQRAATQQDVRFITATVRVSFEKSGDGRWLISNLDPSVLPKPAQARPAP